ncbi:1-phosphatidylinositol 4,5-bisphosphate phosphodiesterase delta-4 [Globomyces sp. JEL0801]|nr:1-phosphatidylinositol 4,5-bisphosphate phosphodiesterase delta-4 [Globomyces sp. JEL0801]
MDDEISNLFHLATLDEENELGLFYRHIDSIGINLITDHSEFNSLLHLMKKLNIFITRTNLQQEFKKVAKSNGIKLTQNEFKNIMIKYQRRKALENLYLDLATNGQHHTHRDVEDLQKYPLEMPIFLTFLTQIQKENQNSVANILSLLGKSINDPSVSYLDFLAYFHNKQHFLYDPDKKAACTTIQLIDSHNTYLEGAQTNSSSSIKAYEQALLLGCRCVEIDCWDVEANAISKKISLRGVVEAIKKTAFVTSPFPVILSLELHCSPKGQEKMAAIFVEVLGDLLLQKPLPNQQNQIPNLSDLQYKVIIKGRGNDTYFGDAKGKPGADKRKKKPSSAGLLEKKTTKEIEESIAKDTGDNDSEGSNEEDLKHELSDYFASLVIYQKHSHCKNLSEKLKEPFIGHEVINISETKAKKWMRECRDEFILYNQKKYIPAEKELTLQIYVGCQMVALNYQTDDINLHNNAGFFMQNNNFGYVLKPQRLLGTFAKSNATSPQKAAGTPLSIFPPMVVKPKHITVSVISAYRLPKYHGDKTGKVVDPYLNVILSCPSTNQPNGTSQEVFSGSHITSNGFNPSWLDLKKHKPHQNPVWVFKTDITQPDLSILQFCIVDRDLLVDGLLAAAAIPVDCLKTGYRIVSLVDHKCNPLPWSQLFVYVSVEDAE